MPSINRQKFDAAKVEHAEVVQPEKRAKFNNAINEKNPLLLNSFEERGASIAAKMDRIRANPNYQKLTPAKQAETRGKLYDEYVVPSYKGFGLEVPSKEAWVTMTDKDRNVFFNRTTANSYFESGSERFATGVAVGADKAITGVALYGLQIENKIFQKLHGIDNAFSAHLLGWYAQGTARANAAETKENERLQNAQKQHIDGLNFYLNTHPRDGVIGDLGNLSGEVIANFPLYSAISEVAAGGTAGLMARISKFGRVGSMSAKLAATPQGKFVVGTLTNAVEGYLSGLIGSGGDKKQAAEGADLGLGFSAVGGIASKVASYPMIKKWTASVLSMGGKPFAQDLAMSASHELHEVIEGNVTPELHLANNLKREIEDPLMATLHKAEVRSLTSIGQQLYGRPLNQLSKSQRAKIFSRRLELIDEAAAEAPVHLPEFTKAETKHEIDAQASDNPELGNWFKQMEQKHGGSVSDVVAQNTIHATATDTGIINTPAVAKSVEKSSSTALVKVKQVAKARGVNYNILDTNAFASYRMDTNAYFKNPFKAERIASDGTKIGARDKRAWNEILKSDNRKAFVEVLKEADGNKIYFESDLHRMLFHLGNSSGLEKPMVDKLYREIGKMNPLMVSRRDARRAADWTLLHLYELAKSGKLATEGNMFRSTLPADPKSWTKWQNQLANENDTMAIAEITKSLKRHPAVLKSMQSGLSVLLQAKYVAKSVEDYIAADTMFQDTARNIKLQYAGKGRIGKTVK